MDSTCKQINTQTVYIYIYDSDMLSDLSQIQSKLAPKHHMPRSLPSRKMSLDGWHHFHRGEGHHLLSQLGKLPRRPIETVGVWRCRVSKFRHKGAGRKRGFVPRNAQGTHFGLNEQRAPLEKQTKASASRCRSLECSQTFETFTSSSL